MAHNRPDTLAQVIHRDSDGSLDLDQPRTFLVAHRTGSVTGEEFTLVAAPSCVAGTGPGPDRRRCAAVYHHLVRIAPCW
jgi:hypothetical protein